MSSRDELREALAKALAGSHGPGTAIDAVLAVLDQQGWPELEAFRAECDKVGVPYDAAGLVRHHRGNAEMTAATWKAAHDLAVEQRDAALREAARYEQVAWFSDKAHQHHAPGGQVSTVHQELVCCYFMEEPPDCTEFAPNSRRPRNVNATTPQQVE